MASYIATPTSNQQGSDDNSSISASARSMEPEIVPEGTYVAKYTCVTHIACTCSSALTEDPGSHQMEGPAGMSA